MKYRFYLRLKIQENTWVTVGESHVISWDVRDLIKASSGWFILNQGSMGSASAFIPTLIKGIWELTQYLQSYTNFEALHGLGTIENVTYFYQALLKDCQRYPYAELYGSLLPDQKLPNRSKCLI